jgi:hypothetical protein
MNSRYLDKPHGGNEVHLAAANAEMITAVFEAQTAGKLYDPLHDSYAPEALRQQIETWKNDGAVVAMVFGGFDAPFHKNHRQFLFECKAQAAPIHYTRHMAQQAKIEWAELSQKDRQEYTTAVMADGHIKLVVSTDGDERIGKSKGFNPAKGSSVRPLQSWQTRAENLTGFSLQLTGDHGLRTPIVDAVTVHDHLALPDTIHANPVDMVATFLPDVWALYHEAETDIAIASTDTRLGDLHIVVLTDDESQAMDPMTGKPFSTTALVKRIKGE